MGNFLATIIVFLAALLIMHVLVLFKSRDHKLWLFVDYIWLSMAFLSLILRPISSERLSGNFESAKMVLY